MPPSDPLAVRLADRPAWRVASLAAGVVGVALLAIVVVVTLAGATAGASPLPPRLHRAAVGLPAVLALYALARRLLLRAPASWFLVGRPDRRAAGWLVAGLALAAAALLANLAVLGATPVGPTPAPTTLAAELVVSLAAGALAGVLEELAFRGALIRLLEARWGPAPALGATAAVFALLHQGHAGDGRELALVVASMLAAGLLLGAVALRTRSAWHAAGLHAGWNTVFGGTVVDVAPTGSQPAPAAVQLQLAPGPTLLAGDGLSLGSAPATTLLLLLAAVGVWHAPDRWMGGAA